ncbi:hypothetical protein K469DRAFT_721109 [Zopfia rhizophila CBS 207.26]|uniref:Ankyrin n=1 Tax=Zopfia rhizophila CBS 207.26 TaxID=1314779 RepID=A0A6A6DEY3_9PEZI|nr:hypothetical protein K469DRAFT_721109 [Zopfia rhizophila CBS 207.26]
MTEEVMKAVAQNWKSGNEVMALLQQRGGEVKITEVVKAAVQNRNSGKEVIALLLQQRGDEDWNSGKEVMALPKRPGTG